MNNLPRKILSFLEKLSSKEPIGGLEISDTAVRFVLLRGDKVSAVSFRLPPGIILKGVVQDKKNFSEVLKRIHEKVFRGKKKKIIQIIVCLPPASTFTQSFSVPLIAPERLEEAADLNLQMISPLDRNSSYSDWQILEADEKQIRLVGAFVEKGVVDALEDILRKNNFVPLAFEFPALALARVSRNLTALSNFPASFIVIHLTSDGLDILIIRKGALHFSYFHPWRDVQEDSREVKFEDLKRFISVEVNRVINFSLTHLREMPIGAVIISPGLGKEIEEFVRKDLGLKIFSFGLTRYAGLAPVWYPALGAALRGLIPRNKDTLISLTSVSAEEEYYRQRTLSFVGLWRNILLAVCLCMLAAFAVVDFFLARFGEDVKIQFEKVVAQPDIQEIERLQNKAASFNQLLSKVEGAKQDEVKWSPLLEKLEELAGSQISFDRISIRSFQEPIRIQGKAPSEKAALAFKDRMVETPSFIQVALPLSSISSGVDRRVSFEMTFKMKEAISR